MSTRRAAVLALAAVGLLALADARTTTGEFAADGRLDRPFLRSFQPWSPDCECRVGDAHSEVVLRGLLARAHVSVELAAATAARRPYEAQIVVDGETMAHARLGGGYRAVSFAAVTDGAGALRIRVLGEPFDAGTAYRLAWVRVSHESGGFVPPARWLQYGLLTLLGLGFVRWAWRSAAAVPIAAAAMVAAFALALSAARLHLLASLPSAIAIGLASTAVAVLCSLCALDRAAARWVILGFALRLAFALHPASPSADATFHVHRVRAFMEGQLIAGRAPGPAPQPLDVPYPPLLYALLSPAFRWGVDDEERLVRGIMALLEGTAPLLLFGLMRAAGASLRAAGHAAAAAAVMPEGVLVLAKGIAANILGNWLTMLALAVVVHEASLAATTAALVLALLSHFGAALCLGGLMALWTALRLRRREMSRRRAALMLAAAAAAAAIAWIVYYRAVAALTLGSLASIGRHLADEPAGFVRIRWVRLGKTLQDVVLKFGAAPLLLAAVGLRRRDLPPGLATLLTAWTVCGLGYGALAILTPLPLRFEYFLTPAVAAAAGLGAEALEGRGRVGLVTLALAAAFAIQLSLALLLLAGRFDIISVVMESDRWPFAPRE
ncbi:MAG TPA: hypothetical protein VGQ78_00310 [Vicinamibacteria bacterium]|nr:hypothetical protein [Vicinamibacteria bacterium]